MVRIPGVGLSVLFCCRVYVLEEFPSRIPYSENCGHSGPGLFSWALENAFCSCILTHRYPKWFNWINRSYSLIFEPGYDCGAEKQINECWYPKVLRYYKLSWTWVRYSELLSQTELVFFNEWLNIYQEPIKHEARDAVNSIDLKNIKIGSSNMSKNIFSRQWFQ